MMEPEIRQVCCEMLYEVYTLNGVPEKEWPALHVSIAHKIGYPEWLRLKNEELKAEAEAEERKRQTLETYDKIHERKAADDIHQE